jgi:hypothetical protein
MPSESCDILRSNAWMRLITLPSATGRRGVEEALADCVEISDVEAFSDISGATISVGELTIISSSGRDSDSPLRPDEATTDRGLGMIHESLSGVSRPVLDMV